jgi:hypothetical protein
MLDEARERLGTVPEIADALAANLPQPKTGPSRSRRRRRRKKKGAAAATPETQGAEDAEQPTTEAGQPAAEEAPKPKRRRRRKVTADTEPGAPVEAPTETDAAA